MKTLPPSKPIQSSRHQWHPKIDPGVQQWFRHKCPEETENSAPGWVIKHKTLDPQAVLTVSSEQQPYQVFFHEIRKAITDADALEVLRLQAERLRPEFNTLAEQWRRDTQHLSQISKKVVHPAYFRIVGMGQSVVPLLLEAL